MSKRVLVPVADGSEDIELSCTTDVLVRAGVKVTVASVMGRKEVALARGLNLVADALIEDVSAGDFDAVFLPGGLPGAEHLGKSAALKTIMHEMRSQGKLYGAICAAPVMALGPLGMLEGVDRATCYPGMEAKFPSTVQYSTDCVVLCGKCLTSRGPGTAMFFGLAAAGLLVSKEVAADLARALLVDHTPEIQTVMVVVKTAKAH